jgi:phosphoglycerol transferase MdoB-like AlkP superfamily enzyme
VTTGRSGRLPPRSGLPRAVTVESLPWVGTTWYERGPAYWARRLALTLFALGLLALFTTIVALFLGGVYDSSGRHAWFYGLLAFEIVFSVLTGGYFLYRMIRHPAFTTAAGLAAARRRPRGASGLGILARSGFVLGQLAIVLIAALTYGLWAAALVRSLSPSLPAEREARRRMAEVLRARGCDNSLS